MSGFQASTPAPRGSGYPQRHRLTRVSELDGVRRAGRRLRTEHLEVRACDSLLSHARVAVIVAKYGHIIVERNKVRRRLRELVRTRLIPGMRGVDVVIRALPSAYEASFDQLAAEVGRITAFLAGSGVEE